MASLKHIARRIMLMIIETFYKEGQNVKIDNYI